MRLNPLISSPQSAFINQLTHYKAAFGKIRKACGTNSSLAPFERGLRIPISSWLLLNCTVKRYKLTRSRNIHDKRYYSHKKENGEEISACTLPTPFMALNLSNIEFKRVFRRMEELKNPAFVNLEPGKAI